MAQPKIDSTHMFEVLRHRDANPMITNEALTTWARKLFPRDEFIASPKFVKWIDGGHGSYLEREMHRLLTGAVALERLADESAANLTAREEAESERDHAIEERDAYRRQAESAKLELALMSPPPDRELQYQTVAG